MIEYGWLKKSNFCKIKLYLFVLLETWAKFLYIFLHNLSVLENVLRIPLTREADSKAFHQFCFPNYHFCHKCNYMVRAFDKGKLSLYQYICRTTISSQPYLIPKAVRTLCDTHNRPIILYICLCTKEEKLDTFLQV